MIIIILFLDYTNTGIPLKGNAQKWKYENLCYAYDGATKNNVDKRPCVRRVYGQKTKQK